MNERNALSLIGVGLLGIAIGHFATRPYAATAGLLSIANDLAGVPTGSEALYKAAREDAERIMAKGGPSIGGDLTADEFEVFKAVYERNDYFIRKGVAQGRRQHQQEAVNAGLAVWQWDERAGEKAFRWKHEALKAVR